MRWINVKDKLPPDEDVLLWLEFKDFSTYMLGYYDDDKWFSMADEPLRDITHWALLLKPPITNK